MIVCVWGFALHIHSNGNNFNIIDFIIIGCGYVMVYNSLPSTDISHQTKEQTASIRCCKEKDIHIAIQNVQKQQGGSDCGVFSVAFATSICAGDDSSRLNYIQYQVLTLATFDHLL